MIKTPIQLTDLTTKWGLVIVRNNDNSVNREYMITAEEADDVRLRNKRPPGCTAAEWENGLSTCATYPANLGQAIVEGDSLVVYFGQGQVGDRVGLEVLQLIAGEWELRDGHVWMLPEIARQVCP